MCIVKFGHFLKNSFRVRLSCQQQRQCMRLFHSSDACQIQSPVPRSRDVQTAKSIVEFRKSVKLGPTLQYFISNGVASPLTQVSVQKGSHSIPYLSADELYGKGRKVYFDVYGCQMNVNDTEIVWSILKNVGYDRTFDLLQADVALIMTCSIRENAEKKIWDHLNFLRGLKRRRGAKNSNSMKIGILGCMAERLKTKILDEEKCVDLIAGPDSYKDLPIMLSVVKEGNAAVNVMLSVDETYADIMPVRINPESPSAYVSIMRGCDNMCSYCIVPFTRGRERSRPISSILEEIRKLSDQGIKDITLLGQNVNSYRDTSEMNHTFASEPTQMADGFKTIYKTKVGGRRFVDLLEKVSEIDTEMRIRFTSPHPKDFPDAVLHLIRDKDNICNQLHMPAQSGNNAVLNAMRRGYSRELYLNLVNKTKSILPAVTFSSDFICGFCGETEEAHQETLSLIREVKYNTLFIFPYSLREKTHAHRKLQDDVPIDVKKRRTYEADLVYREEARKLNNAKIGEEQLVLIEGKSKKSDEFLAGRNEGFIKVILPDIAVPNSCKTDVRKLAVGDYVAVKIISANSLVLKGIPLYSTTLKEHFASQS